MIKELEKLLKDLRDNKLIHGKGVPPSINYDYMIIRGIVKIPIGVDFHSITIKHPIEKGNNIRPTGNFKATYTKEERDFVESVGGTFEDEYWIAFVKKNEENRVLVDYELDEFICPHCKRYLIAELYHDTCYNCKKDLNWDDLKEVKHDIF